MSCLDCGCWVSQDVGFCDECREKNRQSFQQHSNDLYQDLLRRIEEDKKCEAMMHV